MIIYNNKEKQGKYVLEDNMLFVINTPLPMNVLYDKLRNQEELTPELVQINAYIMGNGKVRMESNSITEDASWENIKIGKNAILSEDDLETLEELSKKDNYIREPLFAIYERSLFGSDEAIKRMNFDITKPQHREILRRHIALSHDAMPTLFADLEIPLEDARKLSNSGNKLYRDFGKGSVTEDNPLPSKEEILAYEKLTDYEKRLLATNLVHPSLFMELKAALGGAFVTNDLYRKLGFFKGDTAKVVNARTHDVTDELVAKFEAEFGNGNEAVGRKKTRAPRVIKEYIQGCRDLYGLTNPSDFTPEVITSLVDKFNLKSMTAVVDGAEKTTVAQTKNPTLIALSMELALQDFPQQLLKAMAVYMDQNNADLLFKKGIVDWLKENKNTNVSDFVDMLEAVDIIDRFDPEKNAGQLKMSLEDKLGRRDAKLFERKYGFQWADNEIAIRGRHVVVEDGAYRMYMLAPDDPRNFTSGYSTCCCQRWDTTRSYHAGGKNMMIEVLKDEPSSGDNAGGSCVYKIVTDPFAANVVIEKKSTGEIVGQSFVWVDVPNDTFVFDNIEYANDGKSEKYVNIIGLYAKNIPYPNVHLGMGCNDNQKLNGVGQEVKVEAKMPTTLTDRHVYTDYHKGNAKLIKGFDTRLNLSSMKKYPLDESRCHITTAPDEPTKWDDLANGTFSFLLNDHQTPIEQRFQMVEDFRTNPSEALQITVVHRDPRAILTIEHPSEELQMYVFEHNIEIAKMIQNPCERLQVAILANDPSYLRAHNNLSESVICQVLESNGVLLSCIDSSRITSEMCTSALRQNGYAWPMIPTELKNEDLAKIAANTNPKCISLMEPNFLTPEVQLIAARKEPSVILLTPCSLQAQMAAVNRKPDLILQLQKPTLPVVRVAVQQNPTLFRKFQYDFPSLRTEVLQRNGFIARELKNLTVEEYNIACTQNPNVARFIENPATRNNSIRPTIPAPTSMTDLEDDSLSI